MKTGPIYIPLDSWIYPALRRLAAMGYAPDEESLVAPWTREECLLLLWEAEDTSSRRSTKTSAGALQWEAQRLISSLKSALEGESERAHIQVESIYTRQTQIAGPPLRDSYHFGQTIANDYGRPYAQGFNSLLGVSVSGTAGRFSLYGRGEYQQAASQPSYGINTQAQIAALDGVPLQVRTGGASTSRFSALELYLGVHLGAFDITAGKQSIWWGPGDVSAFHFSNNAEPIEAVRVSQAQPFVLPGPLRYLGRVRTQFLIAKLSGHLYPPHPFLNAQKITFQLTPNLEFGFTRSSIFGGAGHPLTAASIARSFFSTSSSGSTAFGTNADPGDRRSGFDFRWHVPGLRRQVTVYSDSLADDDPNPLANPKKSAWGPGVYITALPRLPKLDFRFETYSTWLYRKDEGGQFIYWNNQYRDAYTNSGNLLGSWVGRDARAYIASSTYWFSAQTKITAAFRQTKTGSKFLPGGGTQTDASIAAQWQVRPKLILQTYAQYERYFIPMLGAPHQDVVAMIQFTFYPHNWAVHR